VITRGKLILRRAFSASDIRRPIMTAYTHQTAPTQFVEANDYSLAYLSKSTVALVLGVVATARGLRLAVELGAGAIAVLSLATLILAISVRGLAPRSLPWAPARAACNP
jgi:hypothetical protein